MDVERTMEFILENLAKTSALMEQSKERQEKFEREADRRFERIDRRIGATQELLRMGARRFDQIGRQLEQLTQRVDQLAAAQLVTEQKLQALFDSLRASHDGNK